MDVPSVKALLTLPESILRRTQLPRSMGEQWQQEQWCSVNHPQALKSACGRQ